MLQSTGVPFSEPKLPTSRQTGNPVVGCPTGSLSPPGPTLGSSSPMVMVTTVVFVMMVVTAVAVTTIKLRSTSNDVI